MSKKIVLITGGAGYLGSHLTEILLKNNYRVRCFDKLIFSEKSIKEFRENPDFEFIQGDIQHIEELASAIEGCYAVIHLAGLVGDPACKIDEK